jgi:hypothetical protein
MKIATPNGTVTLDDDACPSVDDMNDIISSVAISGDYGQEFLDLCIESTRWPPNLTNSQFLERCNEWVRLKS